MLPLTVDQRRELVALVVDFLGMPVNPGSLQALVGLELRSRVRVTDPNQVGHWVVGQALARPEPALFRSIVATVDAAGTLVGVHGLLARLDAGDLAWTATFDTLWVPEDWPFADRDELRAVLGQMAVGDGPAAISIEGPVGFGKKTMVEYVKGLAVAEGTFRVQPFDFRAYPTPGVLDQLVLDLRDKLGVGFPDETTHTEPERRATVLAHDLFLDSLGGATTVWLLANVLEVNTLEAGLLRFLDELLLLVQEQPDATPLRIVVLSEGATLLGLKNVPPVAARFPLPEVSVTAVSDWLSAAVPDKAARLYELTADRVIDRVADQPAAIRLDRLKRFLKEAHQQLLGAP